MCVCVGFQEESMIRFATTATNPFANCVFTFCPEVLGDESAAEQNMFLDFATYLLNN